MMWWRKSLHGTLKTSALHEEGAPATGDVEEGCKSPFFASVLPVLDNPLAADEAYEEAVSTTVSAVSTTVSAVSTTVSTVSTTVSAVSTTVSTVSTAVSTAVSTTITAVSTTVSTVSTAVSTTITADEAVLDNPLAALYNMGYRAMRCPVTEKRK